MGTRPDKRTAGRGSSHWRTVNVRSRTRHPAAVAVAVAVAITVLIPLFAVRPQFLNQRLSLPVCGCGELPGRCLPRSRIFPPRLARMQWPFPVHGMAWHGTFSALTSEKVFLCLSRPMLHTLSVYIYLCKVFGVVKCLNVGRPKMAL